MITHYSRPAIHRDDGLIIGTTACGRTHSLERDGHGMSPLFSTDALDSVTCKSCQRSTAYQDAIANIQSAKHWLARQRMTP